MSEVVFASNEVSRNAHKDLYHFSENSYIITDNDLLESIVAFTGDLNKLHIASTWIDILKLAVWKSEPDMGDAFLILRNIGIKAEELLPFRGSGIADIFPWLYYGKRFDVLKKVCFNAKMNAEKHIRNKDIRVHCHLISEETNRIVVSSL